ncbi:S41 family peptidase [Pontibacter locisalis]|uniref:S41 family peptidase n=1 Tax=Pontibacter locisalis TaxID=1719035 RepID=A0ABW5IQG0_9BACT
MRKKLLIIISFVFILYGCSAQPKLNDIQKLESLARVWGFLKYYHPQVASGKYNWDEELIQSLPKVMSAQSKKELSQVYLDWIARLGEVKVPDSASKNSTFDKNFNLSWTDDTSLFTESLISQLDFIEENRVQGKNHYATVNPIGLLDITNENPYPELYFKQPDETHRLLSLFRYWNVVEYFFPYKYLTDQEWDDVLTEMIPKFRNAANVSEYHLAVLELVAKTDDSHAYISGEFAPEVFGYYWIPAKFKIIDGKAVISGFYNDSLAHANDIHIGDVIHRVNGETIESIIGRKSKYIPASNQSAKYRDFYNAVFNGVTDTVTITYERSGVLEEKQVKRYYFSDFSYGVSNKSPKWEILKGNIGYVDMGLLEIPDVAAMIKSLMKCKAIILDVRNYPKGTMDEISNYLNSEPRPYAKFTLPDLAYPGKYYWLKGDSSGRHNKSPYQGQVVLLVNEHTQSHAEFTVMALQTADNATVIGSQTAGADGNIIPFELVGGIKTRISGIGVYYPDGRETQRIGLVPDIEVKPTVEGIRNGKDEVLEKALEYIEKEEIQLLTKPKR